MTRRNFDKPDRLGASNGRLPIKIAVLQGCVQLLSLQDDSGGNLVASQLTGLINQRQIGDHLIEFKAATGR